MQMCFGSYEESDDYDHSNTNDMEIRDHFAGVALQGMLSSPDWFANAGQWKNSKTMVKTYAKEAYLFADAMMEARYK